MMPSSPPSCCHTCRLPAAICLPSLLFCNGPPNSSLFLCPLIILFYTCLSILSVPRSSPFAQAFPLLGPHLHTAPSSLPITSKTMKALSMPSGGGPRPSSEAVLTNGPKCLCEANPAAPSQALPPASLWLLPPCPLPPISTPLFLPGTPQACLKPLRPFLLRLFYELLVLPQP